MTLQEEWEIQVQKSRNAHKSIQHSLRSTKRILAKPEIQILHPVGEIDSRRVFDLPEPFIRIDDKGEERPRQNFTFIYCQDYQHAWLDEGPDHYLLKKFLADGIIPHRYWPPESLYYNAPTLKKSLDRCKQKGYCVPDRLDYEGANKTTYSESEAFYAGCTIAYGDINSCWRSRDTWIQLRDWRDKILYHTGQFPIPDPLFQKEKIPYIVDQLWIVPGPTKETVRLVVLEIDGETHLLPYVIERDRRRDVMLTSMGYEVYHAAGWWCRIDPYRVVLEFLVEAGILPDRVIIDLIGREFTLTSDYVCARCEEPMVRHDFADIRLYNRHSRIRNKPIHSTCFRILDEREDESCEYDDCDDYDDSDDW